LTCNNFDISVPLNFWWSQSTLSCYWNESMIFTAMILIINY